MAAVLSTFMGVGYIGYPRLETLLARNSFKPHDFLTAAQESLARRAQGDSTASQPLSGRRQRYRSAQACRCRQCCNRSSTESSWLGQPENACRKKDGQPERLFEENSLPEAPDSMVVQTRLL